MKSKQIIGELTLRSFGETSKHDVAWVPGYGVTCSSLFTSNGSLGVVARGLESRLDVWQVNMPSGIRQDLLLGRSNVQWVVDLCNAAVSAERERLCVAIKAADDKASEGDYMLTSDDCARVVCGTWTFEA